MFKPIINFCLDKEDDVYSLIVSDITDIYEDPDNLTGWEDASTLLSTDVTSAIIKVTITDSLNVDSTFTKDVTSIIPEPVLGTFTLATIINSDISLIDGLYKVEYTLTTVSNTYYTCKQKIVYNNVACCISNAILKLIEDLTDVNQQSFVDKLKAMEFALIEATKSLDSSSALKILNLLQDYCNSTKANADCGCGC